MPTPANRRIDVEDDKKKEASLGYELADAGYCIDIRLPDPSASRGLRFRISAEGCDGVVVVARKLETICGVEVWGWLKEEGEEV